MQYSAWSCIDFWLVSKDTATWVVDIRHSPRTLSEHSPCLLKLQLVNMPGRAFTWRLPSSALLDTAFREEIRQDILDYFTLNVGSVSSHSSLWEAFKVVIRDKCIARQAGVLKSIRKTLKTLENDIHKLELEYYVNGDVALLSQIRSKLSEHTEEAQREVAYLGKTAQTRRYGEGDRPGKTLAALLRPPRTDYIIELKDENQHTIRGTQDLKTHVLEFYSKLYTSNCALEADHLQSYFDFIELLWRENAHRAYLDEPFSEEDVIRVKQFTAR